MPRTARGKSFRDDTAHTEAQERAEVKRLKERMDKIDARRGEAPPARGAKTTAKAKVAKDEKVAKRAKASKKKQATEQLASDGKPKGQRDLFGEPLPPPPAVSLEEREITQRIATTGHFKASLDGEDMEEMRTAGTFVQRRAIVRSKMKALPKVEEIPVGAKDAECDEITRLLERHYILKAVPFDMSAAVRSVKPTASDERDHVAHEGPAKIVETARPATSKPRTRAPCSVCAGSGAALDAGPCGACEGKGTVPCKRCNGNGEVEWMPEQHGDAVVLPVAVACPNCRAKEHAKDLEELHPCVCGYPKVQHVGESLTCPGQVTVKDEGQPLTYDAKKSVGEILFPKEPPMPEAE
jgi:hypothetical protein